MCICVCVRSFRGEEKGGDHGGGKRGRRCSDLLLPPLLCLPHILPFPLRPPGISLVKSLAIYLSDWSGRVIYIHSVGRLNLATSFKTFKQGRQTQRDSKSHSLSDGGESRQSGQTAAPHTPNKNCCLLRKKLSEEKKGAESLWIIFGGISFTTTCLLSLSFSSSPSSQISMLCFGICAPNPSNPCLDQSFCHLKQLLIISRTLQPNKLRQTFAELHSD